MSDQKVKFYELLDKYCSENGKKTKIITQDLYDKVLNANFQLDSRTKCDDGAKFKYCSKTSLPATTKEETFDTILHCRLRVGHKQDL